MSYCCVPFCRVTRRKENISFFELPANVKQRLLWQNAIIEACTAKGINENSYKFLDRSTVCEKHFTRNDIIRKANKKKSLRPSAVPSFSLNFSSVKETNLCDIREPSSTQDSCAAEELKSNVLFSPSKDESEDSSSSKLNQNIENINIEVKKEADCLEQPIIIKLDTVVSLNSPQNNLFESNSSSKNLENHTVELAKKTKFKDKAKTLEKQLQNKLKMLQRENATLRYRMNKAKIKYTLRASKTKKMSPEEEQFKKIVKENAENKLPAILLFEQIKNFGKKKITLSSTAMKFYFLWQRQFPGGYEFVRKMKCFSLPHKNTLARFVEFSSEGTEEDTSSTQVVISDEVEEMENEEV